MRSAEIFTCVVMLLLPVALLAGCAGSPATPTPNPLQPIIEAALQDLGRLQYDEPPDVIRIETVMRPGRGDSPSGSPIEAWQVVLEGNFWMDASFAGMDDTNSEGLGCVTVYLSVEDLSMLSVESVGGACEP